MFPVDSGSIADWVGAIGGLLAVVASVLAWKSSDRINKRMLALEEKRETDKRRLQIRGQAESIFAAGVKLPDRDGAGRWGIYLFNGSDQPIFDITVESNRLDSGMRNATCEIGLLPPGRYIMPADAQYHWGALVNLDRCEEEVDLLVKGKGKKMITEMRFSDYRRHNWCLKDGMLQEIPEENPSCLLYTSPSPRDAHESRMPSSA